MPDERGADEGQTSSQNVNGNNNASAQGPGANASVTVYNFPPRREPTLEEVRSAEARLEASAASFASPDPLPAGSRLLYRPNPNFTGRDRELRRLFETLKPHGSITTVSGIGGVGKTQLVTELAHRYGALFPGGVFWLNAYSHVTLENDMAGSAGPRYLNLPGASVLSVPEKAGLAQAYFAEGMPKLLIFDNCEDPSILQAWRPVTGGARVVVTARRPSFPVGLGVTPFPLELLSRRDSVALLIKFRPDLANSLLALNDIAEQTGDLPLALHLAGSYLRTYANDSIGQPGRYVHDLRALDIVHASFTGDSEDVSPTGHDLSVYRTFMVSYERLSEQIDEHARRLFGQSSHLKPGVTFPRRLFEVSSQNAFEQGLLPENTSVDQASANAARRLTELGLLTTASESLVIHQLVAKFGLRLFGNEPLAGVAEALLECRREISDAGSFDTLSLLPHMEHVALRGFSTKHSHVVMLANNVLADLNLSGNYRATLLYAKAAFDVFEGSSNDDPVLRARLVSNVAGAYLKIGDCPQAGQWYERAKVLFELHAPTDPNLVNTLHGSAELAQGLGNLDLAESLLTQAISIFEQQGEVLDKEFDVYNTLGLVQSKLGRRNEAEATFNRAMSYALGDSDEAKRRRALVKNNIGYSLLHTYLADPTSDVDLDRIASLLEDAIALRREILPQNHPELFASLNNLAAALMQLDRLEDTYEKAYEAFQIACNGVGENHPSVATCANMVATALYRMRQFEDAYPYAVHAFTVNYKSLPKDHPDLRKTYLNLFEVAKEVVDPELMLKCTFCEACIVLLVQLENLSVRFTLGMFGIDPAGTVPRMAECANCRQKTVVSERFTPLLS